jgi:tetratricopeptide (TPR) repeat protein
MGIGDVRSPGEDLAGRVSPVGRDALDALFATGQWLHARQRYNDASAVFRVIVLCAPDEERGYLALGACHEGLGQDAIALEIYGMAVLTLPAPRCHVARARVLWRAGKADDAEEALDEAEGIAEAEDDDDLRALVRTHRACAGAMSAGAGMRTL